MCENYEKDIQKIIEDKEILIKSSEELIQNKKEELYEENMQLKNIIKKLKKEL